MPIKYTSYTSGSGNDSVIAPASSEVTLKDAIVFEKEGEVIGRLDIKCDFAKLDPSLHQMAVDILMKNRIRLMIPSDAHYEKSERLGKIYAKRQAEYAALPWYKKMFRIAPYYGME